MVQITQSVPVCLSLSAVGGVVEVLATALLAYEEKSHKLGETWSRRAHYAARATNVLLQVTASVLGNLLAPWFGPVSLVGPMFLSAQLVTNAGVFGFLLGLENVTKDMKVGTYVIVISAVLLPVFGPAVQEGQDVRELIMRWYSLTWMVMLVVGMVVSSSLLVFLDMPKLAEWKRMGLVLVARFTSFSINLTVSKMMVLDPGRALLGMSILFKLLSAAVMTHAIRVQSTAVVQAKFMPLNASALIVVNAATGLVLWDDWRVIDSWVGWVCIFLLVLLGNYLLLGKMRLFAADDSRYGAVGAFERLIEEEMEHRHLLHQHHHRSPAEKKKDNCEDCSRNGADGVEAGSTSDETRSVPKWICGIRSRDDGGCITMDSAFDFPASFPSHERGEVTMGSSLDFPVSFSSDESASAPPVSTPTETSAPRETFAPPVSTPKETSAAPISTPRETSASPISTPRETFAPPVSTPRETSAPPISTPRESSSPPISTVRETSAPPISTPRETSVPHPNLTPRAVWAQIYGIRSHGPFNHHIFGLDSQDSADVPTIRNHFRGHQRDRLEQPTSSFGQSDAAHFDDGTSHHHIFGLDSQDSDDESLIAELQESLRDHGETEASIDIIKPSHQGHNSSGSSRKATVIRGDSESVEVFQDEEALG